MRELLAGGTQLADAPIGWLRYHNQISETQHRAAIRYRDARARAIGRAGTGAEGRQGLPTRPAPDPADQASGEASSPGEMAAMRDYRKALSALGKLPRRAKSVLDGVVLYEKGPDWLGIFTIPRWEAAAEGEMLLAALDALAVAYGYGARRGSAVNHSLRISAASSA